MRSTDDFRAKREVLERHCADIGRDPAEIVTSTHLRLDPSDVSKLAATAAEWAEAGLDLGIVYLPQPHTPSVLEPVAEALADLAG